MSIDLSFIQTTMTLIKKGRFFRHLIVRTCKLHNGSLYCFKKLNHNQVFYKIISLEDCILSNENIPIKNASYVISLNYLKKIFWIICPNNKQYELLLKNFTSKKKNEQIKIKKNVDELNIEAEESIHCYDIQSSIKPKFLGQLNSNFKSEKSPSLTQSEIIHIKNTDVDIIIKEAEKELETNNFSISKKNLLKYFDFIENNIKLACYKHHLQLLMFELKIEQVFLIGTKEFLIELRNDGNQLLNSIKLIEHSNISKIEFILNELELTVILQLINFSIGESKFKIVNQFKKCYELHSKAKKIIEKFNIMDHVCLIRIDLIDCIISLIFLYLPNSLTILMKFFGFSTKSFSNCMTTLNKIMNYEEKFGNFRAKIILFVYSFMNENEKLNHTINLNFCEINSSFFKHLMIKYYDKNDNYKKIEILENIYKEYILNSINALQLTLDLGKARFLSYDYKKSNDLLENVFVHIISEKIIMDTNLEKFFISKTPIFNREKILKYLDEINFENISFKNQFVIEQSTIEIGLLIVSNYILDKQIEKGKFWIILILFLYSQAKINIYYYDGPYIEILERYLNSTPILFLKFELLINLKFLCYEEKFKEILHASELHLSMFPSILTLNVNNNENKLNNSIFISYFELLWSKYKLKYQFNENDYNFFNILKNKISILKSDYGHFRNKFLYWIIKMSIKEKNKNEALEFLSKIKFKNNIRKKKILSKINLI